MAATQCVAGLVVSLVAAVTTSSACGDSGVELTAVLHAVPAVTTQVVVVHTPVAATTWATVETFERVDGAWQSVFPAMVARIGTDGFSDHHRESVPSTPTGVYGFGPTVYGIRPDPGTRYPYHRLVDGDWWNANPASLGYNTFQHGTDPGGASEALWQTTPQYDYFAFITYNVPPIPGAGSAIFLHVNGSGDTSGCVTLARTDLLRVLRWLDPAQTPRIVLGPDNELARIAQRWDPSAERTQ
ncbi:L,D-transpeptidase family protein [Nocardia sp. NPDC006044]|uniref:L,D-transpeptidase family protein n=1 Tax=Nocardia sp. NPDC006044 TaxID=3364306 RepID=UPI003673FF47